MWPSKLFQNYRQVSVMTIKITTIGGKCSWVWVTQYFTHFLMNFLLYLVEWLWGRGFKLIIVISGSRWWTWIYSMVNGIFAARHRFGNLRPKEKGTNCKDKTSVQGAKGKWMSGSGRLCHYICKRWQFLGWIGPFTCPLLGIKRFWKTNRLVCGTSAQNFIDSKITVFIVNLHWWSCGSAELILDHW